MAYFAVQILVAISTCYIASTFATLTDAPSCDVISAANTSAVVTCPLHQVGVAWSKNGIKIETVNKKYTVDAENGTLTIISIGEPYIGDYVCSVGNVSATVVVCSAPYVRGYDKAKNVIEGDPFQAECSAWGFPQITVTWYRDAEALTTEISRVSFKNGSVENSTIRIEKMTYDDDADYVCVVTNSVGYANATLEVNVKDKYAALWPFLGICAEVFILCVIIYLYERRRAKQLAKEAQNEETDFMTANNDTRGSEEVRHRK